MKRKPESEGINTHNKWKTEQKIKIEKYEDLLKAVVEKNEPLGKYQAIFNILKQKGDFSIGIENLEKSIVSKPININ